MLGFGINCLGHLSFGGAVPFMVSVCNCVLLLGIVGADNFFGGHLFVCSTVYCVFSLIYFFVSM